MSGKGSEHSTKIKKRGIYTWGGYNYTCNEKNNKYYVVKTFAWHYPEISHYEDRDAMMNYLKNEYLNYAAR